MKNIPFFKMNGSGNDFIVINDQNNIVNENIGNTPIKNFIINICKRGLSVGADGVILIKKPKSENVDFLWDFYNADGSIAEMCGNGARCVARFAFINRIAPLKMKFMTLAGIIQAEITSINIVKVGLTKPSGFKKDIKLSGIENSLTYINTGVPHVFFETNDVNDVDVFNIGRFIRYHDYFKPSGTNVNFVEIRDKHKIKIRTYERGVENETLACGTGATASALISIINNMCESPVEVLTKSDKILKVYATTKNENIENVFLEGDALISYIGSMTEEAWEY